MKKSSKVTEAYAELGRLGREPMTPETLAIFRKTIAGSNGLLASRAVEIAADHDLRDLVPEMIDAFARFSVDGAEVDKGCRAKSAIVKALNKFEFLGADIFRAGAYYQQWEGSFGPPEDTAVDVRANCAVALARIVHPEAHFILTDLLVDHARPVRAAAAKALTYLGDPEGEVLLRLKILTGDRETEVIGECFLGLMTMSPRRSLDFVERYLDDMNPAIAENAALAIGSSHLPEALEKLIARWKSTPYARSALALPIALIRNDDAFDFLLDAMGNVPVPTGVEIVNALHLFSGEQYIDRVQAAVDGRNDRTLSTHFRKVFGD